MAIAKRKIKYPENLYLKAKIKESGRKVNWFANRLGVSKQVISTTINGHYKGIYIVPKLLELLNQ